MRWMAGRGAIGKLLRAVGNKGESETLMSNYKNPTHFNGSAHLNQMK